ncbi:MAG: hypothetical protein M3139_10820 [Bacteroidota bacterium]|nr:hypothetical protein [Bacteroidota bacterium]
MSDPPDSYSDQMAKHFEGGITQSYESILDTYLSSRDLLYDYIGNVGITYHEESTDKVRYLRRLELSAAKSTDILFDKTKNHYYVKADY